jgi:Double zinc ribbon
MTCSRCQAESRDGARFCRECGATFGAACSSCGAKVEPGSRFCNSCGAPLAAAITPAPAPSHRARNVRINLLRGIVGATIVATLALVVTLRVGPRPVDGSSPAARASRRGAGAGLPELEGRVKTVEPDRRTIQVSSGLLGLGATLVALGDETQILVGDKEGALGDLRQGVRVRVAFDARPDTRVARVIEVLIGGVSARRPRPVPGIPTNAGLPGASDRAAGPPEPTPRPAAGPPPTRWRAAAPPAVATTPAVALPPAPAPDPRHSGTVMDVGRDSLVVAELGRAGEEQTLHVTVTPATRIIDSDRNPHATSGPDQFTATPTTLTDIQKGDFVVIDVDREGQTLVAQSVMVTLRRGGK